MPSLNSEFPRVLLGRRTIRQFGRGRLSLEQLSVLLWLTWGVTGRLRWPGLGKLLLKTSPSGGARHPIEAYCWALGVAGLPRGVYHYQGDGHYLERLRNGAKSIVLLSCARARNGYTTARVFRDDGSAPRVMWRYGFSRAYRTVFWKRDIFARHFAWLPHG